MYGTFEIFNVSGTGKIFEIVNISITKLVNVHDIVKISNINMISSISKRQILIYTGIKAVSLHFYQ